MFYEKSIVLARKRTHELAIMYANCMGLQFGGKDAGKNFSRYLDALLPDDFKKAITKSKGKTSPQGEVNPLEALRSVFSHIPGDNRKRGTPSKPSKALPQIKPQIPKPIHS